jgi:hypothetical protein
MIGGMFDKIDVPRGPERTTWDEDDLEDLEGRAGALGVLRRRVGRRRGPERDDEK